jgi:Rrf2 family transcriptional regulator, cysteine metabolism repressor
MKFTARERTALRAMVELACRYGAGGPTSLSEVARAQELSLPYLEQVVGSLRRAGLLESVRGAHGGYFLTREPSSVRVGDVFRAVERSLVSVECVSSDATSCSRRAFCAARNLWQMVMERLEDTLDSTTLADLISPAEVPTPIERTNGR